MPWGATPEPVLEPPFRRVSVATWPSVSGEEDTLVTAALEVSGPSVTCCNGVGGR